MDLFHLYQREYWVLGGMGAAPFDFTINNLPELTTTMWG